MTGLHPPDGGSDGRRRDWRLPAIASSVPVLRRGLTDFLEATLPADERYDFLLAVREAASNAVEHARGACSRAAVDGTPPSSSAARGA